jgi:hypothetical protein
MQLHDPESKTIKIPVIIKNGQIIPTDPGLNLKDRTIGELTILATSVPDEKKRQELLATVKIEIVPPDTMLLALMKPYSDFGAFLNPDVKDTLPPELMEHAFNPRERGENIVGPIDGGILIPFIIRMPLKMELRGGSKTARLDFCHCDIVTLQKEAGSVNHAYTVLSEVYEPRRMSHTGNVFTKIYYLNVHKRLWEPLEAIRQTQMMKTSMSQPEQGQGHFWKIPTKHLRPLIAEAKKSGSNWIEQYLAELVSLIKKTPLRYRTFGPYWWLLKKSMIDRGVFTFGDEIDREWFEQMDYGREELNIAAASAYEDMRIDGKFNIYEENHVLEDTHGNPYDYIIADSDVERLNIR